MPDNLPYSEKELLLRIAEGDTDAYKQLFTNYWGQIYANAIKFTKSPETAKDLAQDIFIKVWVNRQKLTDVRQFRPYLYRIAKNTIFDHFDKKVFSESNEAYLSVYFEDDTAGPHSRLEIKQLEENIETAIEQLPAQVRTAFRLSRKEGLSHEEIALRMNISRVTSKSYISRAILFIKDYLSSHSDAAILSLLFFHFTAFHFAVLPSLFV